MHASPRGLVFLFLLIALAKEVDDKHPLKGKKDAYIIEYIIANKITGQNALRRLTGGTGQTLRGGIGVSKAKKLLELASASKPKEDEDLPAPVTEKVVDGQIIKGPESCIEIRSHGGAWWLHCKTCEEALADEAMKQELLNRRLGRGLQSPWFNPLKGCPVVSPSPAEKLMFL